MKRPKPYLAWTRTTPERAPEADFGAGAMNARPTRSAGRSPTSLGWIEPEIAPLKALPQVPSMRESSCWLTDLVVRPFDRRRLQRVSSTPRCARLAAGGVTIKMARQAQWTSGWVDLIAKEAPGTVNLSGSSRI